MDFEETQQVVDVLNRPGFWFKAKLGPPQDLIYATSDKLEIDTSS